ncbi:MAG: hypothetical protein AAFR22_01345 [Chloroflexota bacterium]
MRKSILLILSLVLLLSFSSVASAQSGDFEFCGDLSAEDCDLYYSFFEEHTPIASGGFDMVIDGAVTADGTTFDATINVDGAFVYNLDEYNDYLTTIEDLTLLDISVDLLLAWLEAGVDAFDGELFIEVTPPAMFAFMLPVETVDLDLWLVDGVGYVDLTPLGLLAEDPTIAGIYGVDALQAMRDAMGMVTLGQIFDEMDGDDMDGGDFDFDDFNFEDNEGFQQFQNQLESQEAFQDADVLGEFITFTRMEDSEVDGVAVAVFQTEVDFAALFASEAVLEAIEANIPEEDMEDVDIETLIPALQESIAGSTFVVTESYGLGDGILYASALEANIIVDPAPFMAMEAGMSDMGTADAMIEEEPIQVEVSIDLIRFDINALEEVTVPADATILTTEDLMQMAN